jgi:uncharacterized protein Smg (DUF494 family)
MNKTVRELVFMVLRRLDEPGTPALTETSVRSWLTHEGFKRRDIDAVLKIVSRCLPKHRKPEEGHLRRVRCLAPYEDMKLSTEARNALMRLDALEILDMFDREILMDRLTQVDGEVGLDELDMVLASVCGYRDVVSQQTIRSAFYDMSGMYH